MVKRFILIKKKKSKGWLGAIPITQEGTTRKTLNSALHKKTLQDYTYKIVSETQLKDTIIDQRPQGANI